MARFKDIFSKLSNSPELMAARTQMDLALMLEAAMNAKSMTKADLAGELGCTRSYVTQALRGDKNFSILSLAKMATALDCELKVAVMPKEIYNELINRLSTLIKKHEAERIKLVQAEVDQVRKNPPKVVDLNKFRVECENNESIYLAA